MKIPADIPAPRLGMKGLMGRVAENAIFWAVLVLLGVSAVTSFYYEEQVAVSAPLDQSRDGDFGMQNSMDTRNLAAAQDSGKTAQRILRYQLRDGQLTIYP